MLASVHAGILPPPGPGRHNPPQDQAGTTPLRTMQAPPWDQVPSPGTRQAPPWTRHPPGPGTPPPPAEHTGRYGQRAGGMHPTGMQSYLLWRDLANQKECTILAGEWLEGRKMNLRERQIHYWFRRLRCYFKILTHDNFCSLVGVIDIQKFARKYHCHFNFLWVGIVRYELLPEK